MDHQGSPNVLLPFRGDWLVYHISWAIGRRIAGKQAGEPVKQSHFHLPSIDPADSRHVQCLLAFPG